MSKSTPGHNLEEKSGAIKVVLECKATCMGQISKKWNGNISENQKDTGSSPLLHQRRNTDLIYALRLVHIFSCVQSNPYSFNVFCDKIKYPSVS